jgi:cellulose synthase/poly-beta-1,6-N-acetylglucosamine synthase-like glycosyltransferase
VSTIRGTVVVLHRGVINTRLVHWLRRLPGDVDLKTPEGNQIPRQRNEGVYYAQGEWVLFMDSDTVPLPQTLDQLLSWGEPIVAAVLTERYSPHQLVAVKSLDPPARYRLQELPTSGLVPAVAVGTGCILIRRPVFEAVKFPWFRCGQIKPDLLLEDSDFCIRAAAVGFPTWLDAGLRLGHCGACVFWPGRDGRRWVEWDGPVDYREPLEDVLAVGAEVVAHGRD